MSPASHYTFCDDEAWIKENICTGLVDVDWPTARERGERREDRKVRQVYEEQEGEEQFALPSHMSCAKPRLTPSPDLHSQPTTSSLLTLLLAPITSYISVLTLLAIPSYTPLLSAQPYATRLSIGQAVVSSVLKNNTAIETPEDSTGVLGLCQVLVKDVKEGNIGGQSRRMPVDLREMAEEQGWVARMVHLFRNDDLGVQFEVCLSFCPTCWREVVGDDKDSR